jgi:transposase-like protein
VAKKVSVFGLLKHRDKICTKAILDASSATLYPIIENFWNQAKRHMRKSNGAPKQHFGLFLKECEWRFNNSEPSAQLT